MQIQYISHLDQGGTVLTNVANGSAVISYPNHEGDLEAMTIHLSPQTSSIGQIKALIEEFNTNSSLNMVVKYDPVMSTYNIAYEMRDHYSTLLTLPSCLATPIMVASDYAVYNTHIRDIIVYKGGLSLAITLGFI